MPLKPSRWIAERLGLGAVGEELVKQAIDQPLHVLMCVASVCAIASLFYVAGALSLWGEQVARGIPGDLLLIATILGESATVLWVAIRELCQWPSSRWWDPPLDWLFEAGGCALGGWLFWMWIAAALC